MLGVAGSLATEMEITSGHTIGIMLVAFMTMKSMPMMGDI